MISQPAEDLMKNPFTSSDLLLSYPQLIDRKPCKCCLSETCVLNQPPCSVAKSFSLMASQEVEGAVHSPSSSTSSVFNPYNYGPEKSTVESNDLAAMSEKIHVENVYELEDSAIKVIVTEPLKAIKTFPSACEKPEDRRKFARFRTKKYICDTCDHTFTMKQNCAQHFYLYHHPRKAPTKMVRDKIARYQCTKCDKIFARLEQAQRHEKKAHGEAKSEKKVYSCEECQKIYNTAKQLHEHVQVTHENLRPYKCDQCEMVFGRSGGLRRHVVMVHDQQMLKCPYPDCDHPGYKCSKALTAHIRSKHTFVRPYHCLHCEKTFVRSNDLKVHEQTHSLGTTHECEICGATFKRLMYLQKHQKRCIVKSECVPVGRPPKSKREKLDRVVKKEAPETPEKPELCRIAQVKHEPESDDGY